MKTIIQFILALTFVSLCSAQTNELKTKNNSLPDGATDEWLNNIQDENGNKIIEDDDEGDAMQEKFFTGYAANDNFGFSVSAAGDVNGDGFSDIIIGAPFNDAAGSDAGRAYIYFGGNVINSGVDVILTGAAAGDKFGISVSSAGDVNGDGFFDVIVGANFNDAGGSNAGRAYIYFGGNTMNNVADVMLTGTSVNDYFGSSLSSAGDVNSDGYSDVIIGAIGNDAGGTDAGRAYIYFGGSVMNNIADVTLTGAAANDFFGYSVTESGDVNADGYGDVLVGAPNNDNAGADAGRAYIYFGGAAVNNVADIILNGAAAGDNFGWSVSSAGDVNGDGFFDLIIGAPRNDAGGSNAGRAYVYLGGVLIDNIADVTFTGTAANDNFGNSVSSAGDVNSDSYSDVIIGAPNNSSAGASAGRAHVYFGGISMDNITDEFMSGAAVNDNFGYSVASSGDMNGDGYGDMIVGAIYNDAGGSDAGRTCVYVNSMIGTDIPNMTLTGGTADVNLGFSVSSAGDVNGDRYTDMIVGGPGYSTGGTNPGKAYIFYGGINMDNTADVTMNGAADQLFGTSVSSAGDVNGDGYSDVIVGAHGGISAGAAYIFFGGAAMNNAADVIMSGEVLYDAFGYSVSSAGDVNGDGYSDVIIGAQLNNEGAVYGGKAYIYFGGNSMNNAYDVALLGYVPSGQFGHSVSTAGDVNGDGFSDVIAGAPFTNSGPSSAYIYYGGSSMNNSPDVTLTGEEQYDLFGTSISTAGDVNGDGFGDVIVGTPQNNNYEGKAYIYFGGNQMDNISDLIIKEVVGYNLLGSSVSTAGDVNGDGYSDVVIGANGNTHNGNNSGRAYIYFGGKVMNNISDIIMTTSVTGDNLGFSVSSAGDLNNDGFSDLIIGAPFNDAGGNNSGRTYIYLSSPPSVQPILTTVKDVPNDQGGKLYLKWARSGYDVSGINKITSYTVLRSYPPVNGNFAWQTVSEINAEQLSFYSFTDNTPVDSSANNSGTFFYRIKAKTSNISEYWYSAILSGRSLDNYAPEMVQQFSSASVSNNIRLTWKRNTEPDLYNYVIYRSVNPSIDPDAEALHASTADSAYLDTAPLTGAYYYFIYAQDIHNNKSPVSVTSNPVITLNLTLFIEGFYNTSADQQVSDTVKVYLRSIVFPYNNIDSAKAVLSANGSSSVLFGNAAAGKYYIVITHRNALETWSKPGGETMIRGGSVNYDMTDLSLKAYGNNIKQIDNAPVMFGIFSGDVSHDGLVDLSDILLVYNDGKNFNSGYIDSDVNGDSIVDLTDLIITNNNAVDFVSMIRP